MKKLRSAVCTTQRFGREFNHIPSSQAELSRSAIAHTLSCVSFGYCEAPSCYFAGSSMSAVPFNAIVGGAL